MEIPDFFVPVKKNERNYDMKHTIIDNKKLNKLNRNIKLDYLFSFIRNLDMASFCNSVLYPIQSISLNRLIPSKQRATLISVNSMAFSVGMVLFFPIMGALADGFGLAIVFAGLGILLTVGVVAARNLTL